MIQLNWQKIKTYAISILIPVALGAIVGILISGAMDYESLPKPPLAPPPLLFPIAWSILYVLMGVSYGILRSNSLTDTSLNALYYSQLAVNLLWPIFFFVLKWRLFAFIWIVVLLLLVIIMAVRFYNKNHAAGLLQLPYVAWVAFASYLNIAIYLLSV